MWNAITDCSFKCCGKGRSEQPAKQTRKVSRAPQSSHHFGLVPRLLKRVPSAGLSAGHKPRRVAAGQADARRKGFRAMGLPLAEIARLVDGTLMGNAEVMIEGA